jgi:hypothetical protein
MAHHTGDDPWKTIEIQFRISSILKRLPRFGLAKKLK